MCRRLGYPIPPRLEISPAGRWWRRLWLWWWRWWWFGYSSGFCERAFPHGLDRHGLLSFSLAVEHLIIIV